MSKRQPDKDPNSVEPYHIIWCSLNGNNTNAAAPTDTGELKGATISTSSWSISPAGTLTKDSSDTAAVTIAGIAYGINTVATIMLSAGTVGLVYELTNTITTSDSRTLEKTIEIRVKEL